MSDIAASPVPTPKSWTKLLVMVLVIVALLLTYGAGIIALPISVLRNVQTKNCDSVLSLYKLYTSLYPAFIEDGTLAAPVRECEVYLLAASSEASETWQQAYDAYQAYLTAYPHGMYAQEAHERSAAVLMRLVEDQIEQHKYPEALANLTLITLSYSDTATNDTAWGMFPSVYSAWGTGLRESGDFEHAAQVLSDFKTWSQNNLRAEFELDARRELAQTYLDWGQECQTKKEFEEALAKFDLAVAADPDSKFESAAEVKAGQRQAYAAWGNDLLKQGDYSTAIQKFELAVAQSQGRDEDGVNDALANAYIQWANDLSAEDDFLGALEHLEAAQKAAMSDATRKSVDAAFQDTYLAFSNSTGKQAQRAMQEALELACKKHKAPSLPIFALNKDLIHVGAYGTDMQLPENLAAKTPGEMHYAACSTESNLTITSRHQPSIVAYASRGYYFTMVEQFRVQIVWNIILLKVDNLQTIAEESFLGSAPPPFSDSRTNVPSYFFGQPPDSKEIAKWLQPFMK